MKQIYIIEDGLGHKKIGITGNIKTRMAQLKIANPKGIISVMISDFMQDASNIEKQLHEANKEYRLSGEWFEDVVDFCNIEFSCFFMDVAEGAVMISQDLLASIATDKEIRGQTIRVFLLILSKLDFENNINIRQVDITKELEMQKGDVSRSMKLLVDKGIILKVKEGRTAGYKLNPHYGWKGQVSNRNKEIDRIVNQRVVDMKEYLNATEKTS